MVWFWSSAAQVAAKMEQMRAAEKQLLQLAHQFGRPKHPYELRVTDTLIPRSVVPLECHEDHVHDHDENYVIHGVHVESKDASSAHSTPLVLLHGYANGASYFYRNLVGLSRYFTSIHSLDLLGWGLSSRPRFHKLNDDSPETAQDFFVESLEAWRKSNHIDKMILAGHSIGGHLSIAYCERYPEKVERLVLLSPAGVAGQNKDQEERWKARIQSSWRSRLMARIIHHLFENDYTPGGILRAMPTRHSQSLVQRYVNGRLRAIVEPSEQKAVADYLWTNSMLPGSGEYCLNRFLTPFAMGRNPTLERIPNLQVESVSFLYGSDDWMDATAGLEAALLAQDKQTSGQMAPTIDVYRVNQAGHLLMLDNWEEFNAGIVLSVGGRLDQEHAMPTKLKPMRTQPPPSRPLDNDDKAAASTERTDYPDVQVST